VNAGLSSPWTLSQSERAELLDFLRRLVSTRSLSGAEGPAAALMAEEMRRLGYADVRIDAAGNVIGRVGPADGPALLLDCHLDTVDVADRSQWTFDPWGATARAGRLYGLGACDMKAGLAASVCAGALLLRRGVPLRGQFVVAGIGLEEPVEGTISRVLLEEDGLRPAWVIIPEPSDLQVIRAQRGHVEMLLGVFGRSAHSSHPHLGENAIYLAAQIIAGLQALAGRLPSDPFLGQGSLVVTDVRAHAASRSAIPDRCELWLDRRLTAGEDEASALAEVRQVIAESGVHASVEVIEETVQTYTGRRYTARRASPPWILDEEHPLAAALLRAARAAGLQPGVTSWPFCTEGAYTAGVAHIPTAGFGPGRPAVAHTPDEWVELEQVYAAAGAYAALADELLT